MIESLVENVRNEAPELSCPRDIVLQLCRTKMSLLNSARAEEQESDCDSGVFNISRRLVAVRYMVEVSNKC